MSKAEIKKYLAKIGAKGGRKSRRTLTPEQAREMVQAREKKRKQCNVCGDHCIGAAECEKE